MNATSCRIISQTKRFAALGVILAGVLAGIVVAEAKDLVPFKAVCHVQMTGPFPLIATGMGAGTHVGDFTSTVKMVIPVTGELDLVLTAANGDKLFCRVTSVFNADGLLLGSHAEINGGTGRFKGADGFWDSTVVDWVIVDDQLVAFTEVVIGKLTSAGANKK